MLNREISIKIHSLINDFFELSIFTQFTFFLSVYIFLFCFFFLLIGHLAEFKDLGAISRLGILLRDLAPGSEGLLGSFKGLKAPADFHVPGLLIFTFQTLSWVNGILWQAFLIAKLFYNRHDFEFSKKIAFYSPESLADEGVEGDGYGALVFKFFSKNSSPLYNTTIKAVFKYYDHETKTFQHYPLSVSNQDIPVLDQLTPFRVYISLGTVKSAVYTKEIIFYKSHKKTSSDSIILTELKALYNKNPDNSSNEIIIYIEARDGNDGRSKIDFYRYCLADLETGMFASIEPDSNGRFTVREIASKIDVVTH